jgi:hypothetical protein
MTWKRISELEKAPILGWWESSEGSCITITEGVAHIVHKGQAVAFYIPAEVYSENVATAAKKIAEKLV